MPRLPHLLLSAARRIDPLLPLLLRACRDLASAQNELRWLREHHNAKPATRKNHGFTRLKELCRKRSKGTPLQYILGTEYFGELEIECAKGVLIPRRESAQSVAYLASILTSRLRSVDEPTRARDDEFRILDLCAGTGCMSLLLAYHLQQAVPPGAKSLIHVLGIDISPHALRLARRNARRSLPLTDITFARANVLNVSSAGTESSYDSGKSGRVATTAPPSLRNVLSAHDKSQFDILLANPPYVSRHAFSHDTTRSVRNWEPRHALVPPYAGTSRPGDCAEATTMHDGDIFYAPLIRATMTVDARVTLLEVADMAQALRVAHLAYHAASAEPRAAGNHKVLVEIWRDEPGFASDTVEMACLENGVQVRVRGVGEGRSVVLWC